jgi:hypothetical protein
MDAGAGRILAATLTASDVADASLVGPLLDQVTAPVASSRPTGHTTRKVSTVTSVNGG